MTKDINILIAFEQSGVTRRAFERFMGENCEGPWGVVSCDLLPSEDNSLNHIVGDAVPVIGSQHWNLILAHPPCTAIAVSGNAWYGRGMPKNCHSIWQSFDGGIIGLDKVQSYGMLDGWL